MPVATRTIAPALGFDPAFGGLDLSAYPHLNSLPEDTSFIDERFAPLDRSGQGHGSTALKQFLAEQIAESEGPTSVIAGGHKFRVTYHDGAYHAEGIIDGVRHRFAAKDREALLGKIGQAMKPENPYRELSENEKLQVIRACQAGDKLTAIGSYLRFAIGEARASKYHSPLEMMHDAALVPIMDKCANFCWFHCNPHALDSPAWDAYRSRILAGRPVTFALLDAIWLRYQDHLEAESDPSLLRQTEAPDEPEETPRESLEKLNALDDDEVDDLMKSARQQYAREVRAGSR